MNNNEDFNSFNTDVGILTIGAVAKHLNVHPRTLRIYDQENILTPQRSEGDRRLYSLDDVEKAKVVLFLTRNLALNLSGVKIILAMLKKLKIEPKQYLPYIKETAKIANINTEIQEKNITKNSNRGRKPKAD